MSPAEARGPGEGGGGLGNPTGRRFHAGAPPKDSTSWAASSLLVGALIIGLGWQTLTGVRGALQTLGVDSLAFDILLVLLGLAFLGLLVPAGRSLTAARIARTALAEGDLVGARVAMARSRSLAWTTIGYAGALALLLMVAQFMIANDLAVSRTFFRLPLIISSFGLVLDAFWTNVYIFCVAEVLVLVWGLVVAVARLAPGPAGQPIRLIATFYVDVFRGLPAIINIYLIGFGIPLTGLPIVNNLSQNTFAILALTLTYGAYVA